MGEKQTGPMNTCTTVAVWRRDILYKFWQFKWNIWIADCLLHSEAYIISQNAISQIQKKNVNIQRHNALKYKDIKVYKNV